MDSETGYHHHRRRSPPEAAQTQHDGSSSNVDYNRVMEGDGLLRSSAAQPQVESHTRSLLKGLTWRCLATSTTTIIAYLITGQVESALRIGFFEFFAKLAIYYMHERAWTKIRI